jgi:hypothetical protein
MPRFLVRIGVTLASAAIGLGVAVLLVPGFKVRLGAFIFAVIALTIVQALLAPLVARLVGRHVPALEGGVGVISTLVSLLVVALVPGGVSANRLSTWLVAAVIVWLFTGVAGAFLSHLQKRRAAKEE